jgi:hypothetical protein
MPPPPTYASLDSSMLAAGLQVGAPAYTQPTPAVPCSNKFTQLHSRPHFCNACIARYCCC